MGGRWVKQRGEAETQALAKPRPVDGDEMLGREGVNIALCPERCTERAESGSVTACRHVSRGDTS